jgi:hypothetical protein
MSEYVVTWQVEVEADSHREAAKEARKMQLDPDSEATFFTAISSVDIGRGSRQIVDVNSKLSESDRQKLRDMDEDILAELEAEQWENAQQR